MEPTAAACLQTRTHVGQGLIFLDEVIVSDEQFLGRVVVVILQRLHLALDLAQLVLGLERGVKRSQRHGVSAGSAPGQRRVSDGGLTVASALSFSSSLWLAVVSASCTVSSSLSVCCIFFCRARSSSSVYREGSATGQATASYALCARVRTTTPSYRPTLCTGAASELPGAVLTDVSALSFSSRLAWAACRASWAMSKSFSTVPSLRWMPRSSSSAWRSRLVESEGTR